MGIREQTGILTGYSVGPGNKGTDRHSDRILGMGIREQTGKLTGYTVGGKFYQRNKREDIVKVDRREARRETRRRIGMS